MTERDTPHAGHENPTAQPADSFGFERILYEKRDWRATITINRPEVLNALDFQTLRELERAFEDVLKEGVRRGEFRSDLDTRLAVLGLLGMANGVASWYRAEEAAVDRISAEFIGLILTGVARRPGPRRRPRRVHASASGA